jgi:uncharacterized protein YeaO (DUF488 family)
MKIHSSYHANYRKIPEDMVMINIAQYPPRFYNGLSYRKFSPSRELLGQIKSDEITFSEFKKSFQKSMGGLSLDEIKRDLENLSGGKDIVLLCFEKEENNCHRKIVLAFLKKNGFDVAGEL